MLGLWSKVDPETSKIMFAGDIDHLRMVVKKNPNKKTDKDPDYDVFLEKKNE